MKSVRIPLTIEGQNISIPCGIEIVEGSENFVVFEVNISDEWQGLMTFLQFQQEGLLEPINSYLDENNCVKLPPELKSGWCTIIPGGGNGEITPSGTSLVLYIKRYMLKDGTTSTTVTPDLYHQLVAMIQEIRDAGGVSDERLAELVGAYVEENGLVVADNSISIEKLTDEVRALVSEKAADGITPHIENGNWFLGDVNTGVKAVGENGYTPIKGVDYFDGKDAITEVKHQTESTVTIQPNTFNIWDEVLKLNIGLATPTDNTTYNEYMFQFTSGETATTLTLPDAVKWVSPPAIEANKTYQCSIVNNIGVLVGA